MKAFIAEAEWKPRKGYSPTEREMRTRMASSGSTVWHNPTLGFADVADPELAPDELLIKVHYCGICGSDTHVYEADADGYIVFSGPARLPCVLGHEYSGEVVEVGSDVKGFKEGDLVTGESVLWCGKCEPCRRGMVNQCDNVELMGLTSDGAFVELVRMKAAYCWLLNGLEARFSRDGALKAGALVEPVGCAYNGIFVSGRGFGPGAYAVVYGAGPIGLGSISLLRAAGAAVVVAVDVVEERLALARKMGADYAFNPRTEGDIAGAVMDITGGWGADLQVEAAGAAKATIPLIEKLYSKRSKVIYLGRADSYGTLDLNRMVSGAHGLVGSRGHSGYGIFPDVIRLMRGGRLPGIEEMVTSVYPFESLPEAFKASTRRTDGKILVKVG